MIRRIILVIYAVFFLGSVAIASNNLHRAKVLKSKISQSVFQIPGVNGLGIGTCDSMTGYLLQSAANKATENCVKIYAQPEVVEFIQSMFVPGQRYDTVYVAVVASEAADFTPKMGGSN